MKTISAKAVANPLVAAGILGIGWLLWVNWQLWRNALVKGALPWIGIAYALAYLGSLLLPTTGPVRVGEVIVVYVGQFTWYIWLGILLIRDKVTAYA